MRIEAKHGVPFDVYPPPLCVQIDAAKYLLIRLCLRKSGKWHRLNSLKYQHELGEEIATALETLCIYPKQCLTEGHPIKQEEREIIDLTLDEIDTTEPSFPLSQSTAEAGPSSIKLEDLSLSEQPCGDLSFFAQDHTHAELSELLGCLSLEELRRVAKDMKIRGFSLNVSNLSILVLKSSVLLCAAGSNRGRTDQTGIFSIDSVIRFCSQRIQEITASCST